MKNTYLENERKIQPYKTTCRKCEKEEDVPDMLSLASEGINGHISDKPAKILSNGIKKPGNILNSPDKIAIQFIQQQREVLKDTLCRSRRINLMFYLIDSSKYNLHDQEVYALAKNLITSYSDYPSVAVVTESNGVYRIDHISSNLSATGLRMTQVFKPYTLYNEYKSLKENRGTNTS